MDPGKGSQASTGSSSPDCLAQGGTRPLVRRLPWSQKASRQTQLCMETPWAAACAPRFHRLPGPWIPTDWPLLGRCSQGAPSPGGPECPLLQERGKATFKAPSCLHHLQNWLERGTEPKGFNRDFHWFCRLLQTLGWPCPVKVSPHLCPSLCQKQQLHLQHSRCPSTTTPIPLKALCGSCRPRSPLQEGKRVTRQPPFERNTGGVHLNLGQRPPTSIQLLEEKKGVRCGEETALPDTTPPQ